MTDNSVTNRNHLGLFVDLRLGPKTLAEIGNLPQFQDLGPNWNSFETGLSLKDEIAKWNLGFHFGSNFSEHGREAGIILSPDHGGNPSFRTKLGILWTKESSLDWSATPVTGFNFSIPTLKFGDSPLGMGLRPFAEMEFAFGFNADPIERALGKTKIGLYPDIFRLSAGVQFVFGDATPFKNRWNNSRAIGAIAEQISIVYPLIGYANIMGAYQSTFIDYPMLQFPFLMENKFFIRSLGVDFNPGPFPKEASKEDLPLIKKRFMATAIQQASMLGFFTSQMMGIDSSIIEASKKGEVDAEIPLGLIVGKGLCGMLALGVAVTGKDHPGEFPLYGGHSQKEVDEVILRGDTKSKITIARDFTQNSFDYLLGSKDWAQDYRSRGAEYLGHSLLLQSGIAALDYAVDFNDKDATMVLMALVGSVGFLAAVLGSRPSAYELDRDPSMGKNYTEVRIKAHANLFGAALITYGVNEFLKSWEVNTF